MQGVLIHARAVAALQEIKWWGDEHFSLLGQGIAKALLHIEATA